jgi:putative PIN family toxin of toxin-antitoxin system
MGAAVRVVLDTNVLLSLFVFADSRYAPLRGRLESGAWQALTDPRCLHEFQRVLTYPIFSLDAAAQAAAYEAYARLATVVAAPAADPVELPECEDPDDQKFLEVARDGHAQWLVTSDKALLKLARRKKLAHLFGIVPPERALEIGNARLAAAT